MEEFELMNARCRVLYALKEERELTFDEQDELDNNLRVISDAIDVWRNNAVQRVSPSVTAPKHYRLYHVIQHLPFGCDIARAKYWAGRILKIEGISPNSRYSLEQSGEKALEMGKNIHLHMILWYDGPRSVLLQRICQKKIVHPNLTEVRVHDNVNALTSYLQGNKEKSKQKKVAVDRIWRQINNLDVFYQ